MVIIALVSVLSLHFISTSTVPYTQPLRISAAAPIAEQEPVQHLLPVRLKIPALNVDSMIEHLGVTSNGEMDTTKNPDNVAWYKPGKRPGEVGSAVIAGHSGWKKGAPAAFDHLKKLQVGDEIYVQDETGKTLVFVVQELKEYDPADDATSIFSSNDGKSHLNLITCYGAWDKATSNYSKRLVAFTDKR